MKPVDCACGRKAMFSATTSKRGYVHCTKSLGDPTHRVDDACWVGPYGATRGEAIRLWNDVMFRTFTAPKPGPPHGT